MNFESLNKIIIIFSLVLVSLTSSVSACFMLKPEKIEYVRVSGLLVKDLGPGKSITNISDYVPVLTIPDQCWSTTYYLKSWLFYTVVALVLLIVVRLVLRRNRKVK